MIADNESGRQVQRYIRLSNLIPGILQKVDEGQIALTPAVELSYLTDTEQADLLEEAHRDGFKPRVFTDPFLERQAIQRAFAEYLLAFDTLLVHGSAVATDGEGFLFTAHSGTGKSTHTRLWRQILGDRAVIVNDDKPFLQLTEQGVVLHGSPWSGKHGLDCNLSVPLKGICILQRGQENKIDRITVPEALPMLVKQSYQSLDAEKEAVFLRLVAKLSQSVPLWKMACTKAPEAAVMAWETMSASKCPDESF